VIAGQQTTKLRTPGWTICESDLVGVTRPYTRLAQELAPTMPLRAWLDQARRTSIGPVPGPVFLSIPEDLIDDPQPVVEPRVSVRPNLGVPDITAVADALRGAERPLIVVGGQLARFGGAPAIESLSLSQAIPLAYEAAFNDRLGAAPGHPNMFGHVIGGAAAIEQTADVVLVIGAKYMADAHVRPSWFPEARFIAHVNADPAKLEATRAADWAAAADPAATAAALRDALSASPAAAGLLERRTRWMAGLRGRPLEGILSTISHYVEAVAPLHDALDHGWVVDESVLAIFAMQHCLSAKDGRRYISTSGGSLGWGTGAAVGVALASGEPVTLVIGDGSLRFGALGLWSIAARKLPITIIVLDNGGYGSTRMFEQLYVAKLGPEARPQHPGYLGSDLRTLGPSVHSIIEGFGIPCRTLQAGEDARGAVLEAWEKGREGPVALVLPVDFCG
jgi:thiamine pyrophosphate-dependent acetolactate synthase large subunit-like protein